MKHAWLALLLSLAAGVAGAGTPGALAVRNARIVTAAGPAIERGNVIVRGGLIESVGAAAAIPPDAWIIEGAGLTVYPGFTDALSSWGIPKADDPPRRAVQPARGPEDRPLNTSWVAAQDLLQPRDRTIERARNAGFTSAVVFPSAGIFAGQGAWLNLAGEKAGQMVVASPVGQYLSVRTAGANGFPGSLLGAFAYIRQVYLDAASYRAEKAMYAKSPRGMRRPEYDRALEGVLASPRALLPAETKVELDRMVKFGAELKRPVILYGGHDAARAIGTLKPSGVAVLVNLQWPERPKEAGPGEEDSLRTLELREAAPGAAAALVKAGVPFAFYSGGIEKPSDVRAAVKKAIDAGLSREEAVKALTVYPAQIYGVADRVGTIEPGKIANLTVVDGDWFQEKAKVRAVIVDGVKYEPLAEAAEERSK